jgi:PilZ domain
MDRRRRTPRVVTPGWPGRYVIEDEPDSEWGDCRVLDLSVAGVGLELLSAHAVAPDRLVGHRLVVHLRSPAGDSVALRLVGEVRNVSPGPEGGVRAGLEFVGLSDVETQILKILELLRVVW